MMVNGILKRRHFLYASIVALGFSIPVFVYFSMATGTMLDSICSVYLFEGHRRIAGYCLALIAFVLVFVVSLFCMGDLPTFLKRESKKQYVQALGLSYSAKEIAKTTLVILLCWLPAVIVLFPGTSTAHDGITQLYQFFTPAPTYYWPIHGFVDADFIDDSPLITTFLFGSLLSIGRAFGSDTLGFFLICAIQMLFSAISIALMICYSDKLKTPKLFRLILLAFVLVFPVFPAISFTMQKDAVYTVCLTFYAIHFIETWRTKGESLNSKSFLVCFIVVSCLSMLTRRTGLYVVVLCSIVLILALHKQWLKTILTLVIPLVVSCAFVPYVIYPVFDVMAPDMGKSLHMVNAQVLSLYYEKPEAFDEEDLEIVDKVLNLEKTIAQYDPTITDSSSNYVNLNATKEETEAYYRLVFEKACAYPMEMVLVPFVRCVGPFLIPSTHINLDLGVNQEGIEHNKKRAELAGYEFNLDVKNPKFTKGIVDKLYNDAYRHTFAAIPGSSLFFTIGLYSGWIPFGCLLLCLYYSKKNWVGLVPSLSITMFHLVCPVAFARYMYPSIFLCFLAIAWALYCVQRDN